MGRDLSPSTASATPSTRSSASSTSSTASAPIPAPGGLLFLRFGLWGVVYQECLEGQTVREDVVPDVVASDRQGVQLHRIPVLYRHLYGFEVGIHGYIHSCDGSMDLCTILQLNGHRFVAQFHEKPAKKSPAFEVRSINLAKNHYFHGILIFFVSLRMLEFLYSLLTWPISYLCCIFSTFSHKILRKTFPAAKHNAPPNNNQIYFRDNSGQIQGVLWTGRKSR